ncbi:LysR family transcriptional regulator [Rhizobium sp. RM]|uniref:LysR family transcriptional regulator n=1 Tax=Rhizobium sp. RM TaxID=2748079 RepID=UPI00110D3AFB|nr:LysR family transcriptional regulator [Rhizobium sp. RM]NWJ24911.1 LysR family transcriptional regulator [Rhizobium sp. RM]TMV16695.1 LysR family transcriptional regulator [Rhizobium sp. Td3]
MKNITWDSYQLFLDVSRSGGLTGAASLTGLSPATVGRRMVELEERIGKTLFQRSQTGYTLTVEGRALFDRLQAMENAAKDVEGWQKSSAGSSLVRIALGTWNAWLLTANFAAICTERDDFRIDLFIAEQRAALAHREHDIGIRAFAPEERNLAAIRTGDVAYAPYRLRNAATSVIDRWLAVSSEQAISAYLQWPHANRSDRLVVTVNRPTALLDLALSGAGVAILPCFVGDTDARLMREGGEIEELRHSQWIVMNNDDRHRRDIRTVADRMTRLIKGHSDLFAGRNSRPA